MSLATRIRSLARTIFHRPSIEQELDQEIRAYAEMLASEKIDAGLDRDQARREALLELGGVEQVKEQVRDVRAGRWLENLAQDLRYGTRTLAKNPGWALVAVLSLALGIGANTAMFGIVNAVLLRPLPYPHADRLVRVTGYYPKGAMQVLQVHSRTMEIAAYSPNNEFNLTGLGEALHLLGTPVSANFFSLLGANAAMGRIFQTGEDAPGRNETMILSHALWRDKFGSDPGVIGRLVTLDGTSRQIIGVMPASFEFPSPETQFWMPLDMDSRKTEDFWGRGFMPLIGRLRPGATMAQARDELRPMVSLAITMFSFPMARNWNADVTVLALHDDLVQNLRGKLLLLAAAVGFVLLISCANVAGLLLSRSVARAKEIAVRASLGASRGRIVRQLLTESVVLALAGGLLGLALAFGFLSVLKSVLADQTPDLARAGLDWQVLGFVSALAIFSGLVSGIAPALSASRANLINVIKAGGQRAQGASGIRLRGFFVAAEVALTVVLVVGAGLLIKTLWKLSQVNPGFRPEKILTLRVTPNQSFADDRAACVALYDELLRRVSGVSGVSDVSATNALPMGNQVPGIVVDFEGHPRKPGETLAPLPWAGAVTPGYFQMMHIPLLAGRLFTEADGAKAPLVVLVSASTAKQYWPGENPVGKHIKAVWDQQWRTVVGVVADVRQFDLAGNVPSWLNGSIYLPYPQAVDLTEKIPVAMYLLLKTSDETGRVAAEARELVRSVNPNVPVGAVLTLDSVIAASAAQPRSVAWLFMSFGAAALILAAIGIFGVVSFSATQRTYEIGVRVALGAPRSNVFRMVLGQGVRLVLAGLAAGVVASLLLSRLLMSLLYGVAATDPFTFAAVTVLLIATAALAGYLPARRASRIDPLRALRVD